MTIGYVLWAWDRSEGSRVALDVVLDAFEVGAGAETLKGYAGRSGFEASQVFVAAGCDEQSAAIESHLDLSNR